MGIMVYKSIYSFRKHTMNLYTYIMFVLIMFSLFFRSLFFLTTIGSINAKDMTRMAALIWTWPYFCQQMATYVLSQRWAFDLNSISIGYENRIQRRRLRRHFSGFIKLILCCLVLLYLFYMFSLPDEIDSTNLASLCQYMAILSFIIAASMLCVFLCGALKSLRMLNRVAGNAAYFEAAVFFFAQVSAGLFNIWLAKGEDNGNVATLVNKERLENSLWDIDVAEYLVPFFILTEYIPSIVFIYQVDVFSKVFTREDEQAQEEQRQRML
jgi:hypothetical protein